MQLLWYAGTQWLGCRALYRFGYGPLGKRGFYLSPGMAWTFPAFHLMLGWILWTGDRGPRVGLGKTINPPDRKSN